MYIKLNFNGKGVISVFGQLTSNGVPVPGTCFFLDSQKEVLSQNFPLPEDVVPNGIELSYIQLGHSMTSYNVGPGEFDFEKEYRLPYIPSADESDIISGESSVSLSGGDITGQG